MADDEDGETGSGSSTLRSSSGVAYAALPANPPAPTRLTPAPSERPASMERPADVTAILNGGTSIATPPTPSAPQSLTSTSNLPNSLGPANQQWEH